VRTKGFGLVSILPLSLSVLACGAPRVKAEDAAKSDYHYRLARNYYQDRNMAMTQRELHESLKLDPDNGEALHLKGFVQLGLNDLAGAEAALRRAIEVRPDLLEARNNLGSVMLAQGRWEEAVRVLEPLLQDPLYPTPAFAHGNVGWAWHKLGDKAKARRHLEMSVFLSPRFCLGFNNLGIVHRDSGNLRAAREAFEKAAKVCPTYADPWYHLGVLAQQAQDYAAADIAFAKCVEAGADSPIGRRCAARQE
jgi:Tfp pilus assembly protein PilF